MFTKMILKYFKCFLPSQLPNYQSLYKTTALVLANYNKSATKHAFFGKEYIPTLHTPPPPPSLSCSTFS